MFPARTGYLSVAEYERSARGVEQVFFQTKLADADENSKKSIGSCTQGPDFDIVMDTNALCHQAWRPSCDVHNACTCPLYVCKSAAVLNIPGSD